MCNRSYNASYYLRVTIATHNILVAFYAEIIIVRNSERVNANFK